MTYYCLRCEVELEHERRDRCPHCDSPRPVSGWPRDALLGTEVDAGRYRVVRRLGRGLFGTVYEVHAIPSGQPWAMKVMAHEYTRDPALKVRFVNESKLLRALEHPSIVHFQEVGDLTGTGHPFMLLELLHGKSTQSVVWPVGIDEPNVFSPDRAVVVARQVAQALAAAHGLGMLHRDLKPNNVILLDGSRDKIKVTDFGIARILGTETISLATARIPNAPQYTAPEQYNPQARLDARVDIWQFGAVLHYLLTGEPPFELPDVGPINPVGLYLNMQAASQADPNGPRPSKKRHALREHAALDRLVSQMLSFEPARRPATAQEVLDRLDTILVVQAISGVAAPLTRQGRPIDPMAPTMDVPLEALMGEPDLAKPGEIIGIDPLASTGDFKLKDHLPVDHPQSAPKLSPPPDTLAAEPGLAAAEPEPARSWRSPPLLIGAVLLVVLVAAGFAALTVWVLGLLSS